MTEFINRKWQCIYHLIKIQNIHLINVLIYIRLYIDIYIHVYIYILYFSIRKEISGQNGMMQVDFIIKH